MIMPGRAKQVTSQQWGIGDRKDYRKDSGQDDPFPNNSIIFGISDGINPLLKPEPLGSLSNRPSAGNEISKSRKLLGSFLVTLHLHREAHR